MANIFSRIFSGNKEKQPVQQEERALTYSLGYNTISSYQTTQAMRLSAVYACTNSISNSVSLLNTHVVSKEGGKVVEIEHPLNNILNLAPNNRHNHFNFFKLLIESLILKGNGYALIIRDDNLNVVSLELLNPDAVQPMVQKDGSVKYIVSGMKKAVDSANMIHLYQHIDETHNGISVLRYADMTLSAAWTQEEHSKAFFNRGGGLLGILKANQVMNNEQKRQLAESWQQSIQYTKGNGIAIIPQGIDFQSISVSPEDEELLAVRGWSIVEICRYFGVSPTKIFDYTHVSYNTLEQTNLSYLQDTIYPYTKLLQDEFNRKLFKPSEVGKMSIEFDYTSLLQTTFKDQAEYYKQLLVNGVMSVNDVRAKLGLSPISAEDGGDAHLVQISYGTLKNVFDGAYIKQQGQDQSQKVDNNAKANNQE